LQQKSWLSEVRTVAADSEEGCSVDVCDKMRGLLGEHLAIGT
jgi:hypothetical protein